MPGPSLDRISRLAELLDHPELTYPSIHVTGTNGKTTTARLLTALACAHGLTTGTFISPHVTSVTERISVCGRPVSDEEFGDEYGRLVSYLETVDEFSMRVTYFETLTALAYLWFADKPVGLTVFEVGMGGTWDATNLVRGDVAVLCPIGLDHKELGSTVSEVATEKAGIIKEGKIAVIRAQRPPARDVIERRCVEVGATLLEEGQAFDLTSRAQAVGGQSIAIRTPKRSYEELYLRLFGEQAARNAAASVTACEALVGRALDERAIREALAAATSPGRIEVVGRHPLIVLDGAHNPDAMEALADALVSSFTWDDLHLVVAMFADKDVEGALPYLAGITDHAYVCRNSSPRSVSWDRVEGALRASGVREVETFPSVSMALEAARSQAEKTDLILVTGSFYTVADVRPLLVHD